MSSFACQMPERTPQTFHPEFGLRHILHNCRSNYCYLSAIPERLIKPRIIIIYLLGQSLTHRPRLWEYRKRPGFGKNSNTTIRLHKSRGNCLWRPKGEPNLHSQIDVPNWKMPRRAIQLCHCNDRLGLGNFRKPNWKLLLMSSDLD